MVAPVIDLDDRLQMGDGEGRFERFFSGGIALVVIVSDCADELGFIFGISRCGLSGLSVTSPPP